ncbi:AMP-binding protein [Arhodomonas sp. SL1]|uniref:AMP-binding protein n=1 Tax=Arhodomonas sp. SL1 TaxID=3425691 RepID=UPI003F881538
MSAETIDELLTSCALPGDRDAVVAMGRDDLHTTSRDDLLGRAARLAAGLEQHGMEPGDRVAIFAPNSTDWIVVALGVMHARGAAIPLDTQMPGEDLSHSLADCRPRFIFTTTSLKERLPPELGNAALRLLDTNPPAADSWADMLAPQPSATRARPDDVAAIFYTSGTTGPPKGVPLTHRNLASNVSALCDQDLADASDRVLVPLPFHHVYPFTVGILTPLTLGAPLIVPFSLVGPQIVRALREGEATVMLGVPRLYQAIWEALQGRVAERGRFAAWVFRRMLAVSRLARRRFGLRLGHRLFADLHARLAPRLRLVVAGGAALDPDLGRSLQALGWEVATGYGLSETAPILTYNPPERLRLDTAGLPLPGVELTIDHTAGRHGEVMAQGPNVFSGYLNLPEKSAEVLDEDGWFHTGDTGERDDEGYLHLFGRQSAMILLSGGENIDPERVEHVLEDAEAVREAGVLEHGDRLAAIVVPEPRLTRGLSGERLGAQLRDAAREAAQALPSHHRPGVLRISLDPLPRTRLGKLRRHKLRELFDALETDDGAVGSRTAPISPEAMAPEDQQLLSDPAAHDTWQYLAERFHDRRLTPDSELAGDLGIDSLGWVELTLALQDRAGIELDDTAITRVETVRDLLREAAGASRARDEGSDLAHQLAAPETMLSEDQRTALKPNAAPRRAIAYLLLGIARLLGRLVMRVEVHGRLPDGGPYLIAPRHLSLMDPLALLPTLSHQQLESLYWAGLESYLFSNRLTRGFSRTAGVLPIDPGAAPRRSLALAAACLQRGHSLIWFPEGGRSPDGRLQALRPGIGRVLAAQPVPVVPVWIEGTREVLPPGRRLPRPGRVRLFIGTPIPPATYGNEERRITAALQNALETLARETQAC